MRSDDNFGWSVYEGNHPFYPHRKRGPTPILPLTIEHHHSEFRSLTGGVVYYGEQLPQLNEAALVQTLSIETGPANAAVNRRIETRVMLRQQGEWAGYSYRWNDEQTDAVLVGKAAFQSVGCAQCHRFAGEGGTVGPDLSGINRRVKKREILESIIEPSKVIADEYAATIFATESGKLVTGRVEREDGDELIIRTGPGNDDVVRLAKRDIAERRKSPISNMPAGTVNVLEKNQILDLLAYLITEGDADAPAFK